MFFSITRLFAPLQWGLNGTDFSFKNSAVMGVPNDQVTVDGYDMTWGTNALGEK